MTSRRNVLEDLTLTIAPNAHAGLWLDKFIWDHSSKPPRPNDDTSKTKLVKEVAKLHVPKAYIEFFPSWKSALVEVGAVAGEAKTLGRMAVGLGDESVLETSVTLHRTYGVPYIPGSALKGVAACYARNYLGPEWDKKTSDYYRTIFGDTDEAGYVTFYDALYIPGSAANDLPLHSDVLTVHHQQYYQNQKDTPPADWDDPNPVSFLSATGSYLVALSGVPGTTSWLDTTFQILQHALKELGVGAKTSSGYGRMQLDKCSIKPVQRIDPEAKKADELIQGIMKVPENRVPGEINQHVEKWRKFEAPPFHKRRVATAILEKIQKAGHAKASAEKPWYKELKASLQEG